MPSFEGACASDWHALAKDHIPASCSQSRFANVSAHRVPIELKALTVSRTLSLRSGRRHGVTQNAAGKLDPSAPCYPLGAGLGGICLPGLPHTLTLLRVLAGFKPHKCGFPSAQIHASGLPHATAPGPHPAAWCRWSRDTVVDL